MHVVTVVETGVANVASVIAGIERTGAAVRHTSNLREVEEATRLVLPGVGSFGAGMAALNAAGLTDTLRARVREGRPTLAICLGMQLLFESSAETPGVLGIGAVPGVFEAFPEDGRSTHFGWNRVDGPVGARFVSSGFAYFAHSYRMHSVPEGWLSAVSDQNGTYISAIEREGVLACQFHPELSGAWGARLLSRWVNQEASVLS